MIFENKVWFSFLRFEFFDAEALGQDAFNIYPQRTEHVAMCIGATEEEYQKFRDVYELTDGKIK